MTLQEVNELIKQAQGGDEDAKNRLVITMIDQGCMKRLSRYLYMNRLMEPDEVKAEFWFGVAEAIREVKDIGDPLLFLSQKGIWRVVGVLRTKLSKGVVLACLGCGKRRSLSRRAYVAECPSCGSKDIETKERIVYLEDTTYEPYKSPHWDIISDFGDTLNGRDRQVYELIMNKYDRESSNNYLLSIAKELHISAPCVSIYVRRIRYKLRIYLQART